MIEVGSFNHFQEENRLYELHDDVGQLKSETLL